jgi:hypothetical protein
MANHKACRCEKCGGAIVGAWDGGCPLCGHVHQLPVVAERDALRSRLDAWAELMRNAEGYIPPCTSAREDIEDALAEYDEQKKGRG